MLSSHLKWGIFYFILCRLFLAISVTFVKLLEGEVSTPMVLIFQNGIGLLLSLPLVFTKDWKRFTLQKPGLLSLRTLSNFLGFSCFFLTAYHLPLVNSVLLNTTSPLFIPLLVCAWFKKPINHKLWIPIAVGFIGICLVLNPGVKGFLDIWSLIGVLGAVLFAFSSVLTRALSHDEHHFTIVFYFFLISTIFSFLLGIFYFKIPPLSCFTLLIPIGISFFLAQVFFVLSLLKAKISYLGPLNYTSILFATFFEWLFWHELPSLVTWIGIILICLGGIATFFLGSEKEKS